MNRTDTYLFLTLGKVNKEEEEEEEEERIPSRHEADYGILLESFKLFDHDFARYGPCAGLTRIERLNLAIKNDVELCPHALAVKDAIDNNLVDFTKPEYRDSVWRNDKGTRGNFGW